MNFSFVCFLSFRGLKVPYGFWEKLQAYDSALWCLKGKERPEVTHKHTLARGWENIQVDMYGKFILFLYAYISSDYMHLCWDVTSILNFKTISGLAAAAPPSVKKNYCTECQFGQFYNYLTYCILEWVMRCNSWTYEKSTLIMRNQL